MSVGQLILVSAPSGAGKTSLVRAALERDERLSVCVSHTTRARRGNEVDGVNYHFVDTEEFDRMVANNEFLEHAQVFDRRYGTAKTEVEKLLASGADVILEIDWQGADQVRAAIPGAASIFIMPPSVEVLQQRLAGRGEDSAESIARRLAEARLEMSQAHKYQFVVVNDQFEQAVNDVLAICAATRLTSDAQIKGNETVISILSAQ